MFLYQVLVAIQSVKKTSLSNISAKQGQEKRLNICTEKAEWRHTRQLQQTEKKFNSSSTIKYLPWFYLPQILEKQGK